MKLLLLILCLQGCTAFEVRDPLKVEHNQIHLTIKFADTVMNNGAVVYAKATWLDNACTITIDPEHYTHSCLGHELQHCLEGKWHGERTVGC